MSRRKLAFALSALALATCSAGASRAVAGPPGQPSDPALTSDIVQVEVSAGQGEHSSLLEASSAVLRLIPGRTPPANNGSSSSISNTDGATTLFVKAAELPGGLVQVDATLTQPHAPKPVTLSTVVPEPEAPPPFPGPWFNHTFTDHARLWDGPRRPGGPEGGFGGMHPRRIVMAAGDGVTFNITLLPPRFPARP